jgi:hypothetical protein
MTLIDGSENGAVILGEALVRGADNAANSGSRSFRPGLPGLFRPRTIVG